MLEGKNGYESGRQIVGKRGLVPLTTRHMSSSLNRCSLWFFPEERTPAPVNLGLRGTALLRFLRRRASKRPPSTARPEAAPAKEFSKGTQGDSRS